MSHQVQQGQQQASVRRTPVPPPPTWRTQVRARAVARLVLPSLFKLQYHGAHHVPAGPALLIPNHPTYMDPWLVAYGLRRWVTWMAWEDAFHWPVVGPLIHALGAFPVDPGRPTPSTIKWACKVLEEGRLLGVFFEGGRTKDDPLLDPPQPGAARIALRTGAPIVPVSVAGARRLWPIDRRLPRPGKVVIRFHPAIHPTSAEGGSRREREARLLGHVAEAIRSGLPADGSHPSS